MCFCCRLHCAGDRNALAGIDILRKICNHPDLLERTKYEGTEDYGNPERSGKLTVALKVCRRLLQGLVAQIARMIPNAAGNAVVGLKIRCWTLSTITARSLHFSGAALGGRPPLDAMVSRLSC